jgi:hypothetical protein
MRFGTWNVRNIYRAGSLETVASKFAERNVDFHLWVVKPFLKKCHLLKLICWTKLTETEGM